MRDIIEKRKAQYEAYCRSVGDCTPYCQGVLDAYNEILKLLEGSSENPTPAGTIKYHEPFDLDRFRAETARDVLAGMMGHERIRYDDSLHECQVKTAIEYADELIKQLKEK